MFNSLFTKLDNFYDSFETTLTADVSEGFLTLNYKNKIVNCRVVKPLRKGKVKVLKSGDSFFVTQEEGNYNPVIRKEERLEIAPTRDVRKKGDTFILVVLSEKFPINVELRNAPDIDANLIPNLQVVEDIYVVDPTNKLGSLALSDLRLDGNVNLITEPYLTFFSYLKQTSYRSFYNYLVNSPVKQEDLTDTAFTLDSDVEAKSKLHILDFIFPNCGLYDKFTFLTAVKKTDSYNPFVIDSFALERPNQRATFQQLLIKFFSTYLDKTKNLVVLNNLFPKVVNFSYGLEVEVTAINYETKVVNYTQINKPITGSLVMENYDKIQIGSTGIIRQLIHGNYLEEI